MTKPVPSDDIHARLRRLLDTPAAGVAVQNCLNLRDAEWQDRVVIADLRARKAEAAAARELDAEPPGEVAARVMARSRLCTH